MGAVTTLVAQLIQSLLDGLAPTSSCGILNDAQQYYIQHQDGRYAVVDANKQAAYLMQVSPSAASKFTASQKDCSVYGFCVDGVCMSRCEGCSSDSGDFETVKFQVTNSDAGYAQWNLTAMVSSDQLVYNFEVVDDQGYFLSYEQTPSGDQMTVATVLNANANYRLIAVK